MGSKSKKQLSTGKYQNGDLKYELSLDIFQKEITELLKLIKKQYPKARNKFYILLLKQAVHQIEAEEQLKFLR